MKIISKNVLLRGGAAMQAPALLGAGVTTYAAPAFAQAAKAPEENNDVIVVTGSIIRSVDAGAAPITTITTQNLDARGISTVQDAIQQLASNNGPALTNSFSANGAFAGGASAVSLRGLSSSSTLVLFDGLRAAYYPLADDGSRNFVDLNTIPDDIVERIDVLRDGASSSYGADAIAGVVNIITKKQFVGIGGRAEAGISEEGNAATQRLTLTLGTGDLANDGYNAYISGFYYNQDGVYNRELPGVYGSDDLRGIGGPNNVVNGFQGDGSISAFGISGRTLYVRPGTRGRYQLLNPAAGCAPGTTPVTPSAGDLANSATMPLTGVCQEDQTRDYGMVAPAIERFGGSARFTAKVGDNSEAYLAVNFQQTTSRWTGSPGVIRGVAPTGILFRQFSTADGAANRAPGSGILTLPVFICPRGTTVPCDATNGTLNPNNPFAASGQTAQIVGRSPNGVTQNEPRSRVYRAAFGINGTVFDGWDYSFDATAMHTDLRRRFNGYVHIQHLLDVVADGSYNFVNPQLNSQAVRDYLTPEHIVNASSDLYQAQFTVGKAVADLPGGPLQIGLGGSIFYEAVDSPSANPDDNGPTQRYFSINAFGTKGDRTVKSLFGEVQAPIIDELELKASGRYDSYSTGQHNFSPKIEAAFKPVDSLTLRATWSRGFRIPSFAEANALPTTGYVSQQLNSIPQSFLSQYGPSCRADNPTGCPSYLTSYSIGNTTLASPDLKAEKSRSITAGVRFEPVRNVIFTVDYYHIKKTGAITSASTAPAIAAYYAGQPLPDGFNVIADAPDPNNPTATPRIGFVESQLINSDTIVSEGIDFGINSSIDLGSVRWTSNLAGSYIIELSTTFPDGTKEKYVDTLGNFNLTAGSGTFRWKGYWQNTFAFDKFAISGTVNYTSGYDLSAMDQGDAYKDCGQAPSWFGRCRVKSYVTFDLNAAFNITDNMTFYVNTLNLFDRLPPIDPVTYGANMYNAVQGGNGIFGRSFRAGAKFKF